MNAPAAEVVARGAAALRRSTAWWTVGAVAYVVLNLAFWPSLKDSAALTSLEESTGSLLEAFGASGIATPEGYLDGQVFALMLPLVIAAMAITTVSSLTAGDEDAGRLELLHALPVSRTTLWLGRLAAATFAVVAATAITALVLVPCLSLFSFDGVAISRVTGATVACGLLGIFHGTVVYAAAGAGASRARAAVVGVVVLVAGYLLAFVVPLAESLSGARRASPWYWAIGTQPVTDGLHPAGLAVLFGLGALFVAAGTVLVNRRDIRAA